MPLDEKLGNAAAKYRAAEFSFIGRMAPAPNVTFIMATSAVKTISDASTRSRCWARPAGARPTRSIRPCSTTCSAPSSRSSTATRAPRPIRDPGVWSLPRLRCCKAIPGLDRSRRASRPDVAQAAKRRQEVPTAGELAPPPPTNSARPLAASEIGKLVPTAVERAGTDDSARLERGLQGRGSDFVTTPGDASHRVTAPLAGDAMAQRISRSSPSQEGADRASLLPGEDCRDRRERLVVQPRAGTEIIKAGPVCAGIRSTTGNARDWRRSARYRVGSA